jgi:hypothetical protein
MKMRTLISALVLALPISSPAAEYFVSPGGRDVDPGTAEKPFRTIRKAAKIMTAGDTCHVRGGIYRETVDLKTSGAEGAPIRFIAWPGERVTLSGAEPIEAEWSGRPGGVFQARVDKPCDQVFVDGEMMTEARWPNARPEKWVDLEAWARADQGSVYGTIHDSDLGETGVDWTGGKLTLVQGWQVWHDVPVVKHAAGAASFDYAKKFGSRVEESNLAVGKTGWIDQPYYLAGKRGALDTAGEWSLEDGVLSLWTPEGDSPANHLVEGKTRDYAFTGTGVSDIVISGFHFVGASFNFEQCRRLVIDNCHLRYLAKEACILNEADGDAPAGGGHTIRNSSVARTLLGGLLLKGDGITVENCLIRDVGSLSALSVVWPSRDTVVRGNTIFEVGHKGVQFRGPGLVERNHIFNGGYLRGEAALIQTGNPNGAGSVVRYNWVHDCHTCVKSNGIGIRGDDQTRDLTMHHNVVWNCNHKAIMMKGDRNHVVNNTCLASRLVDILLPLRPEPQKAWLKNQWDLLERQNENTLAANNVAAVISGGWQEGALDKPARTWREFSADAPPGGKLENNYTMRPDAAEQFVDPTHYDFRPKEGSALIDAGRPVPGFTEGYQGEAPDIGAYEHGGERWIPGCRNSLWLSSPQRRGDGTVVVNAALRLPPMEPAEVRVRVHPGGAAESIDSTLTFTPEDWSDAQTIVLGKSGAAESLSVEFLSDCLGRAEVASLGGIDPRDGRTIAFDRPMLPTEPTNFVYDALAELKKSAESGKGGEKWSE